MSNAEWQAILREVGCRWHRSALFDLIHLGLDLFGCEAVHKLDSLANLFGILLRGRGVCDVDLLFTNHEYHVLFGVGSWISEGEITTGTS